VHSFGKLLNFHPLPTMSLAPIDKTKMVEGANRNFEIIDPLDFLAAVTSCIPNRGEHLVRYVRGSALRGGSGGSALPPEG